ncbi:MAG: bifunctional folylpolyglutamate synthase/dihydrofolate synthase [Oscillospiraceae bacterium]
MNQAEKHMEFINGFSKKGGKVKDLSRIKKLLDAVGNPEKELKFVHIAGTNGKGSMAQMFDEIFIDAGYNTGLFTSPYLIEYNDRIQVNNQNIPDWELEKISEQIRPAVESLENYKDFSQFEITQTIAFLYFAKQKCDVVVLETGVGGLLDSTNIIENPLVSVIGSVSYDHTAILGNTLEEIAFQKAGIIKPHCPCVLSAGNDMRVVNTVRERAIEMQSQLVIPNLYLCKADKWDVFGCEFWYKGENYSLSMGGLHQISNAITVLEAIKFPGEKMKISRENIKNGLKRAKVCARTEVLSEDPLTILDGAHNPDGMKALAKALEALPQSPKIAVVGMLKEKNSPDAIKELTWIVDRFVCVDGYYPLETDKNELVKIIESIGGRAETSDLSLEDTIKTVRDNNHNGLTLICGSLFLAAEIKKLENKYRNKGKE